jgi:hypothetical protein
MNLKYEKITETEDLGVISKTIEIVEEKDATHVHKCRHDEGLPCSREAKK